MLEPKLCADRLAARARSLGNDAELIEGLRGGLLLRRLLRRAAADAELRTGDVGGTDEPAVVRRALDLENRVVNLTPERASASWSSVL